MTGMRTILAVVLILSIMLTGASVAEEKPIVKVLILPKFEVGKMYGDFPGEAQFYYETIWKAPRSLSFPAAIFTIRTVLHCT